MGCKSKSCYCLLTRLVCRHHCETLGLQKEGAVTREGHEHGRGSQLEIFRIDDGGDHVSRDGQLQGLSGRVP